MMFSDEFLHVANVLTDFEDSLGYMNWCYFHSRVDPVGQGYLEGQEALVPLVGPQKADTHLNWETKRVVRLGYSSTNSTEWIPFLTRCFLLDNIFPGRPGGPGGPGGPRSPEPPVMPLSRKKKTTKEEHNPSPISTFQRISRWPGSPSVTCTIHEAKDTLCHFLVAWSAISTTWSSSRSRWARRTRNIPSYIFPFTK